MIDLTGQSDTASNFKVTLFGKSITCVLAITRIGIDGLEASTRLEAMDITQIETDKNKRSVDSFIQFPIDTLYYTVLTN